MNKKKFVKFLSLSLVALTIVLNIGTAFASGFAGNIIYMYKDTTHLGSGILHEHINMNTTEGLFDVNVVRIDMKNEYTDLKGLINPEGLHYRDSVTNMVDKSGAVAGVNGDYFNYKPEPSAMGTLINDGKVISSPIERAYALPTFYVDKDKNVNISYFDRKIILSDKGSNRDIHINTYNKATEKFDSLTVLDRNWGYMSIGNKFHKDLVEVVVDQGLVQDVRVGMPAVSIPANGYVVAGRGAAAAGLREMTVGSPVELFIGTTPNLESIKFAIGGGSIILRDGQVTNTNIVDSGKHPRTGIAVNQDSSEMILVTVDGRSSSSHGMTQGQFARLMQYLGAYNGLNLDGGGSTTMAIKPPKAESSILANKPSGGSQRKVVNSVGVFTKAPKGELDRIVLQLERDKMFANTSNKVTVLGLDGYNDPVKIDFSKLDLKIEGLDYDYQDNIIVPKEAGDLKLSLSYTGPTKVYTDSRQVKVYGDIKNIFTRTQEILVEPGQEVELPEFIAEDINGSKASLSPRDISFTTTEDLGLIENNIFYPNSQGVSGYISAQVQEGLENIRVISSLNPDIYQAAPEPSQLRDSRNVRSELYAENAYKFPVLALPSIDMNLTDPLRLENLSARVARLETSLLNYHMAVSLNGFSKDLAQGTKGLYKIDNNAGYQTNKKGDAFIVNIDSKNGSISQANSYQWMHLKNSLIQREESNIIITSQTDVDKFKDPIETRAFKDMILRLRDAGKNVYVVSGAKETSSYLEDGISYIKLKSSLGQLEKLPSLDYVEFVVNADKVTYSLERIDF